MIVEMESDVCACEGESMYLQERRYWRARKKKERKTWRRVFISRPSRANEKFLQRKVGYCNILDERVNLRQILKPRKISVKTETNP